MGDIRPAPDRFPPGTAHPERPDPPAAGPGRRRARPSADAERSGGAGESGHAFDTADALNASPGDEASSSGQAPASGRGRRGHRSAPTAIAAIEAAPLDRRDAADTRDATNTRDATDTHLMRAIDGLQSRRSGHFAELEEGSWSDRKPGHDLQALSGSRPETGPDHGPGFRSDFRPEPEAGRRSDQRPASRPDRRPDRQDVTETTLMRAIGAIRGHRGPRTPAPLPETDSAWVDRQDAAETRLLRVVDASGEPDGMRRRGPEPAAERPATAEQRAAGRRRFRITSTGVVLGVILALQLAVAISSYSGFSAAYPASGIVADGHQILHSLGHGGGHPDFTGTMPGSPIVAPLLIAAVDHFGGASLVGLMIALLTTSATLAAYLAARRLQGPAVGIIAAGVFAALLMLRPDMVNSCFEPLAVCAMAWAAYCAIRFAHTGTRNMLPLGAALMVLADYADYAAFWWDLAIIAALLFIRPKHDGWHHTRAWSAQRFVLVGAVLLTVCLLAGRAPYFDAITRAIVPTDGSALALGAWFAGLGLARLAVDPDARAARRTRGQSPGQSPDQTPRRSPRDSARRTRRSSPSPSASPGS